MVEGIAVGAADKAVGLGVGKAVVGETGAKVGGFVSGSSVGIRMQKIGNSMLHACVGPLIHPVVARGLATNALESRRILAQFSHEVVSSW